MSKVKNDLMKEIEAKVAKKKILSKQVSKQKTIITWIAEFFTEYEKIKKLDAENHYNHFSNLAIHRLNTQLHRIDSKCHVHLNRTDDQNPVVEVHWSSSYILANSCEEVLALDAASAHFQGMLENM